MPTVWNISPKEFHKIYTSNTKAFYKACSGVSTQEMDSFITDIALSLWAHSTGITQTQVDFTNEIYSTGSEVPSWLLWSMTEKIGDKKEFLPPQFFWEIVDNDSNHKTACSRIFIRMIVNLSLYLAACDDEVTYDEAAYITEVSEKLGAICDSSNIPRSEKGINPNDYITTNEPGFISKNNNSNEEKIPATNVPAETPAIEQDTVQQVDLDAVMDELDELIGLTDIKQEVKSLVNLVKVRKMRTDAGLPVPDMSLHMVFLGNPGTGKTTVARLISKLYAGIGILSKGQLIEVDRSGLVAGYVGQTAIKTQETIKSALGGVLFIDEAYSLTSNNENDFGHEAVDTILKAMEDHRDDLVVIVAGYTEPMKKFLSSNPGLESRFNKHFLFPDYTGEELMKIFKQRCNKNGYTLSEEAEKKASDAFNKMYEERNENFGNARDVRNRFEEMISNQSNRVVKIDNPDKDTLMNIIPEDLPF